jgi:DNA-binding MarR family transcriptional regulator
MLQLIEVARILITRMNSIRVEYALETGFGSNANPAAVRENMMSNAKVLATGAAQIPSAASYVLNEQVGFILREVSQRHAGIFAARIGDLTPTQWAALAKLYEAGPTSQNQLGRMTAMDVATIKGVVDRLTKRGLIGTHFDVADARRRLVVLTPDGRALVEAHATEAFAISEETFEPLSASERKTFMKLLSRMR